MPIDPTTDPDFMKAAPSDQMKYLTSVDSDFAQASPQDQLGYLMHVRGIPSGVSGPAAPQVNVQAPEGPIAQGMTSFETQLSKAPGAMLGFLKNAAQGFPEDTAEHARVLAGQESPLTETGHALQKINPIVSNSEGIDYGATGANLLPLAMGVKNAPEGAVGNAARAGLQIGKTGLKLADVATFNRLSEAAKAISEGGSAAMRELNPPPKVSAPTDPAAIAAARYQDVPLTGAKAPAVQGVDPYSLPRTPPMEAAQSTTIAQHGYHGDSQTMVVQFKNGKVYEYKGVPQKVYSQYQQSESQGSFFANNIKGRYQTSLRGNVKPSPGQQAASALRR